MENLKVIHDLREQSHALLNQLYETQRMIGSNLIYSINQSKKKQHEEELEKNKIKKKKISLKTRSTNTSPIKKTTSKSLEEEELKKKNFDLEKKLLDINNIEKLKKELNLKKIKDNLIFREENFFRELQNFRVLYPDLFFRDDDLDTSSYKPIKKNFPIPTEKNNDQKRISEDENNYYSGFFRVNERLFCEKSTDFLHLFDFDLFNLEEKKKNSFLNFKKDEIDFEDYGVKVSIPTKHLVKLKEKNLKPFTRLTYNPKYSVFIGDHLYKGSESFIPDLDTVSLSVEIKH
ncbi:hypothetical protein HK099_007188 [Clydaea vesicula]|uniref:Uncharacterized protein n=1 Tax=Clydaea vesicula TaxID=447962 RepID=A0AAD5TX50_9FUNG|nr:hypothetical protein HK099_007188 [Clydaea vesicula]